MSTIATAQPTTFNPQRILAKIKHVEGIIRQLQTENAALKRELRVKDEFVSGMNHELRTPLNAILGLTEALQEQVYGPLTPKQFELLAHIEASGNNLLAMIGDVVGLAKQGVSAEITQSPLDANTFVASLLRITEHLATKRQVTLTTHVQLGTFIADEQRLKLVLHHLIDNALKFTPANGTVTLSVAESEDGEWVTFVVMDDGSGIATNRLTNLFDGSAENLGMARTAQLVHAMDGKIAVQSQLLHGSTVTISLPNKQYAVTPAVADDIAALNLWG